MSSTDRFTAFQCKSLLPGSPSPEATPRTVAVNQQGLRLSQELREGQPGAMEEDLKGSAYSLSVGCRRA